MAKKRAIFDSAHFDRVELAEMKVAKIAEKLAWQHGILTFDQEPLENVVREMGRYVSVELVIPDKKLRQFRVGGIFKLGDTDAMFEALNQGFGIQSKRVSENVIYLVSSESVLNDK